MINIADGWFWLLSGLCHVLEQYASRKWIQEPVKIHIVDQRLGTLSLQYQGGDTGTEHIICAVQVVSTQVCQLCGGIENTGTTFGTSINTICEKCWKLDERFHGFHFVRNQFSETALQKIQAGLLVMSDSWFKKHLEVML